MSPRKVLLIGWDAADWRLIRPLMDRGLMPALASLVQRGVRGNLASIEPTLSPLVWTSIATGKLPHKHGVLGFVEPDPLGQGIRPVGSTTRQTKALWNILSEAGLHTHVVGWFASHPAEAIHGVCVSERFPLPASPDPGQWPLPTGAVTPESMGDALAEFRVHPREIHGDQLLPFIPRAAELDQTDPATTARLTELARILAKTASIQGAATWILETQPWDFLGVYFQSLDEFGHHFMPFHPPQLSGVSAEDVALFGQVMESAYCFHDMMLARVLQLAGEDVTVVLVSDHGFESGAHRPGPVANELESMAGWHRPFGVIAMAGPGLHQGDSLYGTTVLDIAPTILQLFGLPVGQDMDGKVLVNAFQFPAPVQRVPTWESDSDVPATDAPASRAVENQAVLDQLIALGYMDALDPDIARQIHTASHEISSNRIASLLQANCYSEAETEARRLAAEAPNEPRYQMKLAQVLLCANQLAEARQILEAVERQEGSGVRSSRMSAHLLSMEGQHAAALACLQSAESLDPDSPGLHSQAGWIHLRQRGWQAARERFEKALTLEPESPHALVGLARSLVRQDRDTEALEKALAAVSLQHFLPIGHFQLGAILSKMGRIHQAIPAFETGLSMQPGNLLAHRYLARLCRRTGDIATALAHEHVLTQHKSRAPS